MGRTVVDAVEKLPPDAGLGAAHDDVLLPGVGVHHERGKEHHLHMPTDVNTRPSSSTSTITIAYLDTDRECVQAVRDVRRRPVVRLRDHFPLQSTELEST